MSRPVWHCEVKLTLVNGTAGCIQLEARDLITLKEVRDQFAKAVRMAETLQADAPVEESRQGFRVVG